MHLWRWLRRLLSRRDDPRRSLAVLCSYWILYVDCIPGDVPNDTGPTPRPNAVDLPPGHPERLTIYQPLSAAERELWAALGYLDW